MMPSCSCRSKTSIFCRAYGGEGTEVQLDKLGGGAWQMRKAKLKKRLLDMADALIRIAAERLTRHAPVLTDAGRALRRVRRPFPL